MTITKNDSATPSRSPVSTSGSAAGRITRKNRWRGRAPRLCAARSSRASIWATPCTVVTNNGLNGRVASTRPPATLHSARKITSEARRQRSTSRREREAPCRPHSIISGTLLSHTAANPPPAAWSLSTCPPGRQKTSTPLGYDPGRGDPHMATSVGFIGVGNMGNPMAGNVLKSFPLTVFDKNPNAMSNLIAAGAQKAGSPQEVLERAEIVMTCLPASPDVEALYLDAGGLVERAKPGMILIDLSSVLPSTPRKIEPRAKQRGVHFLEAPVSGGVSGAKAATLAVMVGGDAQVLERARPVLRALGPNIFSVGPVGAGNTVKAINNMMA